MTLFQKNEPWNSGKIQYIATHKISPADGQPRTLFDESDLTELANSISELGILQPLTVRRTQTGWSLIAGERRLRAAQLAGLQRVPCLALSVDGQTASLLTMVENLQRKDLNFLDESRGLSRILSTFCLSQEALAQKLGRSQPAIANKLRILKLPEDVLTTLAEHGATERHARALLRLPTADSQREIAGKIVQDNLTVAQTETLVEAALAPPKAKPRKRFVPKDIRIFLNSLHRSLKLMQSAGVNAQCCQQDGDEETVVTIRIPRRVS